MSGAGAGFRGYPWTEILKGLPEPYSIETLVQALDRYWHSGRISFGEMKGLYFDVAVSMGIEELLSRIGEPWHDEVFEELKGWALADPAARPIHVFGGIYAYELEPDPKVREEGCRRVKANEEAEADHFVAVIRPRIDAWWRQRGAETK
jgi:hypothetical protein